MAQTVKFARARSRRTAFNPVVTYNVALPRLRDALLVRRAGVWAADKGV